MGKADEIIEYLRDKYNPAALIICGSFADGRESINSDFDATLVYDGAEKHDGSVVCGTRLDVFCYPAEKFKSVFRPEDFIPLYHGRIVIDRDGTAETAKNKVAEYIRGMPEKSGQELEFEVAWCEKMLSRTYRKDTDGFFRWHLLLTESLEIYSDVKRSFYFGPKRAISDMNRTDPEGFELYEKALKEFSESTLRDWIEYIRKCLDRSLR